MAQLQAQLQQLISDKEQKINQLESKEAQVTDLSEFAPKFVKISKLIYYCNRAKDDSAAGGACKKRSRDASQGGKIPTVY
jgi:hypothetical protein